LETIGFRIFRERELAYLIGEKENRVRLQGGPLYVYSILPYLSIVPYLSIGKSKPTTST